MMDYDGDEPTGHEQTLVNEDMARILAYSQLRPDEYGGRWMNRAGRTYGVSFTGSLEQREHGLREVLNHPQRLRVQKCQYSYVALQQVCIRLRDEDCQPDDEVENGMPVISGFGIDEKMGVVRVKVAGIRPDVSQRLMGKYGASVVIDEGTGKNEVF
jgi:hypothetical protein